MNLEKKDTVLDGINYRIKVVTSCSGGFTSEDISDDVFTVFNGSSPPIIVFPDSGSVLAGITTIKWYSSIEIDVMNCIYTLYYSDNDGASWSMLISDLDETIYNWDTTTVPDGSNYRIKIEEIYSSGIKATTTSDETFTIDNMSSLISTIIIPIPVVIASLGMLFWINKRVFRIIEEKKT